MDPLVETLSCAFIMFERARLRQTGFSLLLERSKVIEPHDLTHSYRYNLRLLDEEL